jgi:hypothetical protein
MTRSVPLVLALILVGTVALPSFAQVAVITTTAPLADHSEVTVDAAVKLAIQTAARGAVAMGLPHLRLHRALILQDAVMVEVVAADADASDDSPSTDPTPDDDSDSSARPEQPWL